jgi:pimeloyl-ACP methyl ester carboxylesterase
MGSFSLARTCGARTVGSKPPTGATVQLMTVQPYDEFGLFHENAQEHGLPFDQPPDVRRTSVEVGSDRRLSALVWGKDPAQLVLLHGGAQNAHTWDTVALALGRPLVAIDLPGHGHSDAAKAGALSVEDHAADVARVVQAVAPEARAVVGMSLGGLTALALARLAPDLVRRLVLVDITPGVTAAKADSVTSFVAGPSSFASFDEILARTVEFNPTRTVSSLRRGILHNAVQREDGSWVWRYARFRQGDLGVPPDFGDLWSVVSGLTLPLLLVRGMATGSVVDDADEAELLRRKPDAQVVRVEGAGHSVQGDQPIELARIIDAFVP